MLNLIINFLTENKVEDLSVINVKDTLAETVVIGNCISGKHASAVGLKLSHMLIKQGIKGIGVEGYKIGEWVLVDSGDIVVHLFRPEIREKYNLEEILNRV